MENISKSKFVVYIVFLVTLLIISIFGLTYAWFNSYVDGTGAGINVKTGVLDVDFNESSLINVSVLEPIYDALKDSKSYKNLFTISHKENSNIDACYNVSLKIDNIKDTFKTSDFKYELLKNGVIVKTGNFYEVESEIKLIENSSLNINDVINYEFRIWLSYNENVDQSSLFIDKGTALSAHLVVTSKNGVCS